jgi:opacity protein-like surface antigen
MLGFMMDLKCNLGVLLLCFPLVTFAGDGGSVGTDNFVLSFSAGPSWTNTNHSQTILIQPDVFNTYTPQTLNSDRLLGNGELFVGIQKSLFQQVQSEFGLALYGSSFATLNGAIDVFGDPNLQNYSYQYKMEHWHIALKSKWIATNDNNLNPYLSGSIGVGVNHAYNYSSTPLISQEIAPPPFQANTQAALTYSLGAGFQHRVNEHCAIGAGYQLVSWGPNSLARAKEQTWGKGLSLDTLYTHGVEFNVSYFL